MSKRFLFGGLLVLALVACDNSLDVDNTNSPDRDGVFTNPQDLEVFISGLYAVMLQSTTGGSNDGLQTQMQVMAMENTSGLANFAMGPRGAIPRAPITNQPGSQGDGSNYHDWFRGHRAARQAALGISALEDLTLPTPAQHQRARAFARLVQGIALGNLSLSYDSASIITEADNPEADAAVIVPLSPYQAVNTAALRYLDSAIAIIRANNVSLPNTPNFWFNGMTADSTLLIQVARSYKARFRANVARTPAERALVNWTEVILDANAGVTADFQPRMDPTNGWDQSWQAQAFAGAQWHQAPQFFMGMADSSGAYADYLNREPGARIAILIQTLDRRFPRGSVRDTIGQPASCRAGCAQVAETGTGSAGQPFANTPYFRNRSPGSDIPGDPLQVSQYDFWRSRQFAQASRIGNYPVITASEIRLLAAEGYIRTNQFALAIPLINNSRTGKGVLPAIPTTITDTSLASVVPGGNACVPKVPDPALAYRGVKCGNVWDALKYEYRLESMFAGYGTWFLTMRGWGDLPEGTAIHWPVPNIEMGTRGQPYYGFGGVGGTSSAGRGNYGLFPRSQGGVY
jgi:hypothetical protein